MDARIVRLERLLLAGMGFFGDPFSSASAWDEDNEIGSLWRRFNGYLAAWPGIMADRAGGGDRFFELHLPAPETPRTGRYEVFVGIEVSRLDSLPPALSAKVLPAGDYALLTARGREITEDWAGRLDPEILAPLGRGASGAFTLELYDRRFKGMDRIEESELDFYVPLLPAEGD